MTVIEYYIDKKKKKKKIENIGVSEPENPRITHKSLK